MYYALCKSIFFFFQLIYFYFELIEFINQMFCNLFISMSLISHLLFKKNIMMLINIKFIIEHIK